MRTFAGLMLALSLLAVAYGTTTVSVGSVGSYSEEMNQVNGLVIFPSAAVTCTETPTAADAIITITNAYAGDVLINSDGDADADGSIVLSEASIVDLEAAIKLIKFRTSKDPMGNLQATARSGSTVTFQLVVSLTVTAGVEIEVATRAFTILAYDNPPKFESAGVFSSSRAESTYVLENMASTNLAPNEAGARAASITPLVVAVYDVDSAYPEGLCSSGTQTVTLSCPGLVNAYTVSCIEPNNEGDEEAMIDSVSYIRYEYSLKSDTGRNFESSSVETCTASFRSGGSLSSAVLTITSNILNVRESPSFTVGVAAASTYTEAGAALNLASSHGIAVADPESSIHKFTATISNNCVWSDLLYIDNLASAQSPSLTSSLEATVTFILATVSSITGAAVYDRSDCSLTITPSTTTNNLAAFQAWVSNLKYKNIGSDPTDEATGTVKATRTISLVAEDADVPATVGATIADGTASVTVNIVKVDQLPMFAVGQATSFTINEGEWDKVWTDISLPATATATLFTVSDGDSSVLYLRVLDNQGFAAAEYIVEGAGSSIMLPSRSDAASAVDGASRTFTVKTNGRPDYESIVATFPSGAVSFTLQLSDSSVYAAGRTVTKTVNVQVNNVEETPTLLSQSWFFNADESYEAYLNKAALDTAHSDANVEQGVEILTGGAVKVDTVSQVCNSFIMDASVCAPSDETFSYKKLDFLHGQFKSFDLDLESIVVNDAGQDSTFQLYLVGFNKFGDSVVELEEAKEITSDGTSLAGDDGEHPIFDPTSPLRFAYDKKRLIHTLSGTPVYEYITAVDGEPLRVTLHFNLVVTDDAVTRSSSSQRFAVDVEIPGCMDPKAKKISCSTAAASVASVTGCTNAWNGVSTANTEFANPDGNFNKHASYPIRNCVYAPTRMDFSNGGAVKVSGRSDFPSTPATCSGNCDAVADSYKGSMKLDIPAGATSGSAVITAKTLKQEEVQALPKPREDDIIDPSLTFNFGPCGQSFENPVNFQLYAGVQDPNYVTLLYTAEEVDCNDPSKGFRELQPLGNVVIDADTGLATANLEHFSLVTVVKRPAPTPSFLPKRYFSMGGGCPNDCAGHGHCRSQGKCFCFANWAGFDCSQRECPYGDAWGVDLSIVRDQIECSGRGACNRENGVCECFEGFTGSACDRTSCPSDCSGHGKCRYISELSDASSYSDWDRNRIQSCVCDGGYFGVDCSLRYCPRGDDPQTLCDEQDVQSQQVLLTFSTKIGVADLAALASGPTLTNDQLVLRFTDKSGSNFVTPAINSFFTGSNTNVKSALESLPNFAIQEVTVTGSDASTASKSIRKYVIEFPTSNEVNTGDQPLISCPYDSASMMGCSIAGCRPYYTQAHLFKQVTSTSTVTGSIVANDFTVTASSFLLPTSRATSQYKYDSLVRLSVSREVVSGVTYSYYAVQSLNNVPDFDLTGAAKTAACGASCVPTFAAIAETEWHLLPQYNTAAAENIYLAEGVVVKLARNIAFTTTKVAPAQYNFYFSVGDCTTAVNSQAGTKYELLECSGRGECSRDSGVCTCFPGYQGYACGHQAIII